MIGQRHRLAIAATVALTGAGVGATVVRSVYAPVRPQLMCVRVVSANTAIAYLGWNNVEDEAIDFAVGPDNRFEPGAAERGQPTRFAPGKTGTYPRGALEVTFNGPSLTWHLGKRSLTIRRDSAACPEPTKLDDAGLAAFALPKLAPEPPPKPPEPPPKPPEPEIKAPEPVAPKEATREAKNYVKKEGQPKPKNPPKRESPADAPKSEPAPLTLTGLTTLSHGIGVQAGDNDILGDAAIAATERNTNVALVDDPDAVPDKVGDGSPGTTAPPKRTPPRVKRRVQGVYPEDAPRLGRTVAVSLSLLVGTDGRVKQVKVVRGAGGAFDREAEKVGRQLLFDPGLVGAEPTEQWVPWLVEFAPEA